MNPQTQKTLFYSKEIQKKYLSDKSPTTERASKYAYEILRVEAEAIFNRSKIAIELDLECYIKNKNYLEIVKSIKDQAECIEAIFTEVKKNGKVHNGKKLAYDHYIQQYFKYSAR